MRLDKKNMWDIHKKKYCMVMKMDEVLTNSAIWMTFRNIILSKEARYKKAHVPKFFLYDIPNRQNYLMMYGYK